jgi:hypothetical protein
LEVSSTRNDLANQLIELKNENRKLTTIIQEKETKAGKLEKAVKQMQDTIDEIEQEKEEDV